MKSKAKRNRRPAPSVDATLPRGQEHDSTIVAIGASAGGIEALSDLLSALSPDTGMAFVLVQHLDPRHHSILTELLTRKTRMTVTEVSDGLLVEPNHLYVIPPNTTMSISDRTLHLVPREESGGLHMSVDHFMRALATQKGNRAIGVILSGSGSDGTLGMREIQAHGGMTFAQDEATAKYDGMPRSAVLAGCVDYVLPPRGIAHELARIASHPYVTRNAVSIEGEFAPVPASALHIIFHDLRTATGVDFSHYRQSTILRRIHRRMVVHKIDKIADYVKYLQRNPTEIKALYQDMLINVTSFFRNPKVFDALKSEVFPVIQRNLVRERGIRIWTPGCATGEETYSIAIALLEFLGDRAAHVPIQFFGTDVSESSVTRARNGVYAENIRGDVSPERLQRFFTKVESGYRVSKTIRDMCIFAQHNVASDPPFSQMDLICCRNLLIYMEQVLQSRIISLFHYALRPNGFLVLGSSEGLGSKTNLLAVEDRANKIFSKKAAPAGHAFSVPPSPRTLKDRAPLRIPARLPYAASSFSEAQKEFDRRLLTDYTPATVFINEDLEIIHTRGAVYKYLKLASGRASLSLLKMARAGLLAELRNAIDRAKKDGTVVGKRSIPVKGGDGEGNGNADALPPHDSTRLVNFDVIPIPMGHVKELYFMIVFHEVPRDPAAEARPRRIAATDKSHASSTQRAKLEQELAATKEYLQSVIETQEATNEELQSANEEILSSNEELQSTNEEMETAKEELQSANEELTTVNDELRSRNVELSQVNNDLMNLLSSIEIAVIMIGSDLTIRRFNPKAQKFLGFIPSDIGRPLSNISPLIEIENLESMVQQVVSDFRVLEKELTDRAGVHYQFKILPYRTMENKIDGAVITIVDIAPDKVSAAPKRTG
jgi:two-component system, chemotaxis family, CheB/CheR fusion protein